jgi:hypothetical protein
MNIYYTVYQTTNQINDKIYIGVHKTENPNDDYLGSNRILKDASKEIRTRKLHQRSALYL